MIYIETGRLKMADQQINIDNYFLLLKGLDSRTKLKLISKLTDSLIDEDAKEEEEEFYKLYGSWEGPETSEEIIADIYKSRYTNPERDVDL